MQASIFESFHSDDACPVCVQDALHAYLKEHNPDAPLRHASPTAGSNAGGSGSGTATRAAPALPGVGAPAAGMGT